ncbi:MAG: GrpB family protein [Candidatus Izemoplasmatales bacterium]
MNKKLDEMTNEELWQLFPIILCEYNPLWTQIYQSEASILRNIYGNVIERINHIGSTSVEGLVAKPTIDILLEIGQDTDLKWFEQVAKENGYLVSVHFDNHAPHFLLKKGYTEKGFVGQAFHVHVRYFGDYNELYFRDYLREHEEARDAYVTLKKELMMKYEHDRDKYTSEKGELILYYTDLARKNYPNRYQKK